MDRYLPAGFVVENNRLWRVALNIYMVFVSVFLSRV